MHWYPFPVYVLVNIHGR